MPKRKASDEAFSDAQGSVSDNSSSGESSAIAPISKATSKKSNKARQPIDDLPKQKKSKTASKPMSDPETAAEGSGNQQVKVHANAAGEKYLDLGKKKRAVVRSFKGIPLLDIREYYGEEGQEKPGKKGISLTLEQWTSLREGSDAIDKLFDQQKKK
ncbi:hypothetical protein M413DRAFT_446272 [Hebeloma cylindrosporum]|uniref:Transcriptional coactivator p15 (PC4) C-terminal domain-containing protein n=1 Tax=Hebeloma cylindrosporum TaxID=76867 RepID=A0A0C2XRC0_HEBCY|nr:hypothetical protein M413DRAFT_446272 [Hebeloma cylindrosporum h7]